MARTSPPTSSPLGLVRAGVTDGVKALMARYPHVAATRLLQESGLDLTKLGDREATHSLRSILTFLENAARATGDDCFGLTAAEHVRLKDLDVLGYVLLNSPTLGAAFESACRYFALQQTLGKLSLRRTASDARVTYSIATPASVAVKQHCEMVFVCIVKYCRELTGKPDWAPREVRFAQAAPRDPTRLEVFFNAPVHFRRTENALIFPARDLDLPFISPDRELLPILRRHADELLARIPVGGDFETSVRRQLTEMLRAGNVSLDDVAARLNTTTRSLQRRLSESGTSFQTLLANARLELAKQYLTDRSLSLTEIAFLLGYNEGSSFSRAFHRWCGVSPLDFRRRAG